MLNELTDCLISRANGQFGLPGWYTDNRRWEMEPWVFGLFTIGKSPFFLPVAFHLQNSAWANETSQLGVRKKMKCVERLETEQQMVIRQHQHQKQQPSRGWGWSDRVSSGQGCSLPLRGLIDRTWIDYSSNSEHHPPLFLWFFPYFIGFLQLA